MAKPLLPRGSLNRKIAIERPVADDALDGAGSGDWVLVRRAWASIQDMLPSRGEKIADGINVRSRPARVRMDYRTDVGSEMRFVLLRWNGAAWVAADRIMQIVAGPTELGYRQGLEFMVVEYSPAGNPA